MSCSHKKSFWSWSFLTSAFIYTYDLEFWIALFIYDIFMLILFYYFLSNCSIVNLCYVFYNLLLSSSVEQSSKCSGFLKPPILSLIALSYLSKSSFFCSRIFNSSWSYFFKSRFYLKMWEYFVFTVCVFFLFYEVFLKVDFKSFIKSLFLLLSYYISFL